MFETKNSATRRLAGLAARHGTLTTGRPRQAVSAAAALALLLSLVGVSLPASASVATSGGWTTTAEVSSPTPAPGDSVQVTAAVTANRSGRALVDLEIYGPSGKVHQEVWKRVSFTAGASRTLTTSWKLPADAAGVSYVVKLGVFDTDWSPLHHWNDEAATFQGTAPTPEPTPQPTPEPTPTPTAGPTPTPDTGSTGAWTTSAGVTKATLSPGGDVTITTSVLAGSDTTALVDLEVYSPAGTKVLQRVWDEQVFRAGVSRDFMASWTAPADAPVGTYVVKVGVFAPGWSAMHHWNDRATGFDVVASSEPSPSPSPSESSGADGLPPLPVGWPSSVVELGQSSAPGTADDVRSIAPMQFRYQYLAGGVNTGGGWATWNTDGAFVTSYINESRAQNLTPVFTYYMIYQSAPGRTMGEADGVRANLENSSTMAAYYRDLTLFFQRAASAGGPVVLHLEPDMWAYIQQRSTGDDARTVPVKVAASGVADLTGLPDTAAGLAQAIVRLRDRYSPNVLLGYHLSTWATGTDIIYADPADATVTGLGERTARFYQTLGADFDVAFTDLTDRDAAYKQLVYGDGGASWYTPDDYRRSTTYIGAFVRTAGLRAVLWQLPYGNTKMRALNNTTNHYQDNKVEWLLDEPARTHLDAYTNAGVIAYLFGPGAGDQSCACDLAGDGTTNPDPINGNTRTSLNADDDGGFFREKATSYYTTGPLPLRSRT